MKPGADLSGTISGVPDKHHAEVRLVPAQGPSAPLECTVAEEKSQTSYTCAVPQDQKTGRYTLEVRLLDAKNKPVLEQGKPVVDTSTTVYVAKAGQNYNPQLRAQYGVTAAGYVMPVAGGGFEPGSSVQLTAVDEDGKPVPGVAFSAWPQGSAPSPEDLSGASPSLSVKAGADGSFKAYAVMSPYMSSASVRLVARDEDNDVSVSDTLSILGESVAQISLSQGSVPSAEDSQVGISGRKFPLSYTGYPVELQLVSGGEVITREQAELSPAAEGPLWSSLEDVFLRVPAGTPAGSYTVQAVVPQDGKIPAELQGRVLASAPLTVTGPATAPTTGPAEPPVTPAPTGSTEPSAPEPSAPEPSPSEPSPSEPAEPQSPEPTASASAPVPAEPTTTPVPSASSAPSAPASQEPSASALPTGTDVAETEPVFVQERKTRKSAEPALEQKPVWLQTSAIAPSDPRVTAEPDQQIRSSVLQAQGTKGAGARFDPHSSSSLPGQQAVKNSSAVVNLSQSTPWWPIALMLVVALAVGAVSGAFISRAKRGEEQS